MIRFSAFADEVSPMLDDQIVYLKQAGIHWLEIRFVDGRNVTTLSVEEALEAKQKLDAAGIGVSAIASPLGKYPIDAPFEPHLELLRKSVELARLFETNFIRIFSFYAPKEGSIDACCNEVVSRLQQMIQEVRGTGIRLIHENEAKIYGHSAEQCVELAKHLFEQGLGLAYDPANFVWGEQIADNMQRCWPLMSPYVEHIHVKDWKLGSQDVGSLPGDGDGQIEELIAALAKQHYAGFVTLEPHMSSGGQFGGETSSEQFDAALARVQNFCRKYGLQYE